MATSAIREDRTLDENDLDSEDSRRCPRFGHLKPDPQSAGIGHPNRTHHRAGARGHRCLRLVRAAALRASWTGWASRSRQPHRWVPRTPSPLRFRSRSSVTWRTARAQGTGGGRRGRQRHLRVHHGVRVVLLGPELLLIIGDSGAPRFIPRRVVRGGADRGEGQRRPLLDLLLRRRGRILGGTAGGRRSGRLGRDGTAVGGDASGAPAGSALLLQLAERPGRGAKRTPAATAILRLSSADGSVGDHFGISSAMAFVQRAFLTMEPIIVAEMGGSETLGAAALSVYLGAQAFGTLTGGLLADRMDRPRLLFVLCALALPVHLAAVWLGPGTPSALPQSRGRAFWEWRRCRPSSSWHRRCRRGRRAPARGS